MRNIALLEWGPASLYYVLPRERIKVRTAWLEGGPHMPPFLSSIEDAKANDEEMRVRYALSAFEDLNLAVKNLRRCFGFPYQEYIGYLNTVSRQHRARREHEAILPGLRCWAIFGNVGAVLWIDYAKANQPPGSLKMGPRDSNPFSPNHTEICLSSGQKSPKHVDFDGDDSDCAWSDIDDEQNAFARVASEIVPGGKFRKTVADTARERSETLALVPIVPNSARGKIVDSKKSFRKPCKLQEEVKPPHGSIYKRSAVPGPGYYSGGVSALPSVVPKSPRRTQKIDHPFQDQKCSLRRMVN